MQKHRKFTNFQAPLQIVYKVFSYLLIWRWKHLSIVYQHFLLPLTHISLSVAFVNGN